MICLKNDAQREAPSTNQMLYLFEKEKKENHSPHYNSSPKMKHTLQFDSVYFTCVFHFCVL